MKYRVYASDRWTFNETYKMYKGDVKADLEYNVKYGSVIVDVDEDYDFGEEFDSRDFEACEVRGQSGDENLEEVDVYCEDEEEAERIYRELMEGYDEDSDEYFDFREYLETLGWEFYDFDIYISSIGVEEYEEV